MRGKNILGKLILASMCISMFYSASALADETITTTNEAVGIENKEYNPKLNSSAVTYGDYEFNSSTGTITRYNGTDTDVIVPDTIGGVEVKKIGAYAFAGFENSIRGDKRQNCLNIENIILPSTITDIEVCAFGDCEKLACINIPNSVKNIGRSAFYDCYNLKELKIPNTVKYIDNSAFGYCKSLESIVIPQDTEIVVGDYAFCYCNNLKEIILSDSTTNIGESAFVGCTNLSSINIPNNLKSIGESAFEGCEKLEKVIMNNKLESIGGRAFYGCEKLENLELPDSISNIGGSAFANSISLKELKIPKGLDKLSSSSFRGCSSLVNIEIPDNINSIGNDTFYGCIGLKKVVIPNKVTTIGLTAFDKCNNATFYIYSEDVKQMLINCGINESKIVLNGDSSNIKVNKVTLNNTNITSWKVGQIGTFRVTVSPENAINKELEWKSSNPSVATVDENGKLMGISEGTTTIICAAKDGSGVSATCKVTVVKTDTSIKVNKITLNNTNLPNWQIGQNGTFRVSVEPSNASDKEVSWKSSNPNVATVDENGKLTGVSAGITTITCTAKDGSGISATCKVTVIDSNEAEVSRIILNNTNLPNWKIGQTGTFRVTVSPSNGSNKNLSWRTENSRVATIDQNGTLTGVGTGTTNIYCMTSTGDLKMDTCKVTVVK